MFDIEFDWSDKVYVVKRWDIMGGWVTFMRLPLDSAVELRDKLNESIEGHS